MVFFLNSRWGGAQNIAHREWQTTPFTTLNCLFLLFPLTPSLTLTVPYVQRSHAANGAQSGTPAQATTTNKKGGGRAKFFQPKHHKIKKTSDLLVFLTEQIPQPPSSIFFKTVFGFTLVFVYFISFTVCVSHHKNDTTDKIWVHFAFFSLFFRKILHV